MKTNLILTSAVAMFVAMPTMAAPSHSSNTFPTDGKMQADYTYTNAATSDNMAGVYENSVYANAEYTTNDYTVNAGTYLPADAEATATCTAGSFCPGLQSPVQYNATTAQGITACPTGYTNSAEGASANTECYRTCSIANNGTTFTNIAHATAVSGIDFSTTTATDTCVPTACENGWHVKAAVTAPDLTTIIGVTEEGVGYTGNTSTGSEGDSSYMSNTIIANDPLAFAVDYGNKGMIKGHGRCSTQSGTNNDRTWSDPTIVSNLTDETGQSGAQYCYCQLDSYTPLDGSAQSLSAFWVFFKNHDDEGGSCADDCAFNCAFRLKNVSRAGSTAFRAAVLGAVQSSPASCEANTITINWSDAAQTDIDANNAGSVTYGGNINTPVKAATKKGKTFRGWIFSTTGPSNE